jgi:hypothetical protein
MLGLRWVWVWEIRGYLRGIFGNICVVDLWLVESGIAIKSRGPHFIQALLVLDYLFTPPHPLSLRRS